MFKQFFKKATFVSPAVGMLKKIEDVPDESFAGKMLGDGFAIEPTNNEIRSPINGEVSFVFQTNHAVGLKASNGLEILIHVGIDTVSLKGEGFTSHVTNGQSVKQGQLLLTVDFPTIADKVPSTDVIVVFTNGEKCTVNKAGKNIDLQEKDIITIQ